MRFLIVLAALLISVSSFAETVRIMPPKGVGVGAAVVESFTELLRVSVRQAKFRVVEAPQKAGVTIRGTITKVGSGLLLVLEKQVGSREPYEDSLKIAGEDELDTGTKRLVRAVLAETPVASSETVDDVTQAEAEAGTVRKRMVRRTYFSFGPAWGQNLGSPDMLYDMTLGWAWERDHLGPRLFVNANWAPGSSAMGSMQAGLGLDVFFFGGRYTPYAGLNVGMGLLSRAHTQANKDDGNKMYYSGFTAGAEVGFMLLHTSDVSMFVQADYRPVLGGIGGKSAGIYGTNVGLLF